MFFLIFYFFFFITTFRFSYSRNPSILGTTKRARLPHWAVPRAVTALAQLFELGVRQSMQSRNRHKHRATNSMKRIVPFFFYFFFSLKV